MPAKKSAKRAKPAQPESPSKLIEARIKELPDWRGEVLSRMRRLIQQADPEVVEEWKWRGIPVWFHDGMICTGETYQNVVKLTFAKGASLKDPAGLFNASLEGNARRAIDLHEGDEIDERAFQSLVRAAAALNASKAKPKGTASKGGRSTATKGKGPSGAAELKLLAGGNPQIAKADGDAPVQPYIAAMPGWKSRRRAPSTRGRILRTPGTVRAMSASRRRRPTFTPVSKPAAPGGGRRGAEARARRAGRRWARVRRRCGR